jgi:hypothetical protein
MSESKVLDLKSAEPMTPYDCAPVRVGRITISVIRTSFTKS